MPDFSLTESVAEDIVKPVARDVGRDPLSHLVGVVGALAVIAVLTFLFTAVLGAPGTVFGLFLGLSCVLGLGAVAYALGTAGLVDLLSRAKDRV